MSLVELILSIQQGNTEKFLSENLIDIEYDLIDIYREKDKLNANSEIQFFNAEEIPNEVLIAVNGIEYENVCPLNMLEDLVHDFMAVDSNLSSYDLTDKVINYLEKDA